MADLLRLVCEHDELTLLAAPTVSGSDLVCRIAIDMTGFTSAPIGLKVKSSEEFVLTFGAFFPFLPPLVQVEHFRWLGFPHVLGTRLCLFLDPDREWNPRGGVAEALERLWGWLSDAVAGKFDASTALHHGFGGLITRTPGAPFLVVTSAPDGMRPGIRKIAVQERLPGRLDIASWSAPAEPDQVPGLVLVSAQPLRLGLPHTLRDVVRMMASPVYASWTGHTAGFPTESMSRFRLERLVRNLDPEQTVVLMVAARNLAIVGPGGYDLAAGRVSAGDISEALAHFDEPDGHNPVLEFFHVDDVRPEVTVRRDDRRPTNWFADRTIELWGCGALGSWIAELLVRSGIRRLVLRDPFPVSRGLLVRQNFVDGDVGAPKDEALAARLRLIAPEVDIAARGGAIGSTAAGLDAECALLIDATVSARVAAVLDDLTLDAPTGLLISQVATDTTTATLGLVTMTSSGCAPSSVDERVRDHVLDTADLEAFRVMWDPEDEDLITPARGCSTPTFRGSAADVMGIASSAVSLLGGLAAAGRPGGQLFRLPHSPAIAPALTWVPAASP